MGPAVPGPIPWRAVRDWCEFHGLPGAAVPLDQRRAWSGGAVGDRSGMAPNSSISAR